MVKSNSLKISRPQEEHFRNFSSFGVEQSSHEFSIIVRSDTGELSRIAKPVSIRILNLSKSAKPNERSSGHFEKFFFSQSDFSLFL